MINFNLMTDLSEEEMENLMNSPDVTLALLTGRSLEEIISTKEFEYRQLIEILKK